MAENVKKDIPSIDEGGVDGLWAIIRFTKNDAVRLKLEQSLDTENARILTVETFKDGDFVVVGQVDLDAEPDGE